MKKINIIISALIVVALCGCNLEEDPTTVIEKGKFFRTANANSLEQYCNWFYPRLIAGHGHPKSYGVGMLEQDFDADFMLNWTKNDVSFGHHIAPKAAKDTEWDWENVRACNDFLANYKLSPENENIKKKYAGEVLFFKSWDYFNKVRTYGDVPWLSKVLVPGDAELYKGRDSRILVMDSVLKDIDLAISYLPTRKSGVPVSRVSKDAALALKARICLFEGSFRRYHNIAGDVKFLEEAYKAAGELMSTEYGYSLYTGSKQSKAYYELFIQADYNSNKEVILSKEYNPAVDKGNNVSRQINSGENPFGISKVCADCYLSSDGLPYNASPLHHAGESFVNELNNRDPRLLQTIATPQAGEFTYYLNGKRMAIGDIIAGNNGATATGYAVIKYYNPTEVTPAHFQGTLDAPIFRYAEILLIRAEAGAELGNDPELDKTVNALRARVGFTAQLTAAPAADPKLVELYPTIKGTNANLIREIRRERGIELIGEGLRRYDLMRWACGHLLAQKRYGFIIDQTLYSADEVNKLKDKLKITDLSQPIDVYSSRVATPPMFESPKNYLFSIPMNELSLNPQLKPNNPGW